MWHLLAFWALRQAKHDFARCVLVRSTERFISFTPRLGWRRLVVQSPKKYVGCCDRRVNQLIGASRAKKKRFHSFMGSGVQKGKPPKKGRWKFQHVEQQDVTNIKVMSSGAVPKKYEFENVPQIVLEIHWLSHRLFWSVKWWDMISWKMKDEINGAGLTLLGKPLTISDHRVFFVFSGVSYPAHFFDTWWVMNFPRLGYGHPGHPVGTYFNHPTIVNENISKRTQGRGPGTLKQSQRVEWSFHLNPWNLLGKTFSFFFWMVYFQELHSLN